MRAISRTIAVILTGCLVWQTSASGQAEFFGPGAEVKLKLISGKKLDGTVSAVDAESFALTYDRDRPPLKIPYFNVKEFEVRKVTFETNDQPRIHHARWVIEGNRGKRIRAKVLSGKSYQGSIAGSDEEHFELLPDGKAETINIAFADIRELKPRPALPTNTRRRGISRKPLVVFAVIYTLLLISGSKSSGGLP